ncbi:hypothetical protein [Pseudoalteromonas sp. S2755]|uniref:hypothetical protein n=1 Tax=Pseudoalteromonas sp. S2755 TaxID=2066523 RepID=UPI0014868CFB|nr:hypothetical protein [Pseudoalteromonas sp. S2755]
MRFNSFIQGDWTDTGQFADNIRTGLKQVGRDLSRYQIFEVTALKRSRGEPAPT